MAKAMRLLVFDLDGTLVDSKVDLANSVNHALAGFDLPPLPNETVYTYVGNGATMLIRRALGPAREAILPEVLDLFLDHYRRHLLDTTLPYPGVAETLRDRAGEYEMAVLTNKPLGMTRALLDGLSLTRYFVDVRGGDSFDNKKPHPEGLLRIMDARGTAAGETLMVGDSVNDVLAGRGAGVLTCGVTYGLGAGGFAEHPPDFTVDRFPDVFARIRPGT
ncbi:MAG: HAD-IA family hydrolase [Gemmatimonadota bacterium]